MNLRATFATASLVFASTLTAATYSMDAMADSVADQPVPANMAVKQNPIPSTPRSVDIGTRDYTDSCFGCHGPTTAGASELLSDDIANMSDGQLFWIIKKGHRNLLNDDQKLSRRQIWHLINYLRSK